MDEIAEDGAREGADEMEMLLEDVEHGFDHAAFSEEEVLPGSHDFFPLLVMWRGKNERPGSLPEDLAHDRRPVVAVPDPQTRAGVEQDLRRLRIVNIGGSQDHGAQIFVQRDGCVQLEPVMPALVVLAEGSDVLGYPMPFHAMQLAHFQHRGVRDLDGIVRHQKLLQQFVHERRHPMALGEESPVLGKMRKEEMQVEPGERVQVHDRLLVECHRVPEEDRNEVGVRKDGGTAAERRRNRWQTICYPGAKGVDMVGFQGEHSAIGRR